MTMQGPIVVKYGGSTLPDDGERDPVLAEIAVLHKAGQRIVLVHGGGPEIDRELKRRGIETQRIGGHRVTDAATLEVVEAVLRGTINKRLARAAMALGIRAARLSGEDRATLVAEKMPGEGGANLGFVGIITSCNPALLQASLDAGLVPIVAPLAISSDGKHAYNVNADLAAAAIGGALKASAFIAITNVARVLRDPDDPDSGIDRLTPEEARAFAATEACRSSMKPKLIAAAQAIANGAKASYICAARPGAIAAALAGDATVVATRSLDTSPRP
jgi:acetylglutamate kinase